MVPADLLRRLYSRIKKSIPDHTPGRYPDHIPGRFPGVWSDRCADRFPDLFLPRPVNQMALQLPVLTPSRGKQTETISHTVPPPVAGEVDPSRTARAPGYFVHDNRVRVPLLDFFFLVLGSISTPVTGACPVTTDLTVRVNVRTTTTV